jgi:manganese-dependent ADP-ribose/CDP-alcohol diphosphatase
MRMLVALITVIIFSYYMPEKYGSETRSYSDQEQEQTPLFTFGIIADVQYCDCDRAGTRYYRSSLSKLREAVNSFVTDSVDFVVNLGDLIDRDFASYKPVMNILDSSGLKIWHATGNHDYQVDQSNRKRIPQLAKNKNGYYSFIHQNFKFIVLNGNDLSTYAAANKKTAEEAQQIIKKLRAEGEPNAMDWNGGIGEKQMAWFKSQLDEARQNGEKVIIACHFPVWPKNQHNLLNYREVLNLLENYDNILAWFSGHNHSGNYGNFNLIHFVNFRGMVETEESSSYAKVEIYKNKIWIKGSGREKSQILAL